jgi:hypothetical protein
MSFQDVGRSNPRRQPANAGLGQVRQVDSSATSTRNSVSATEGGRGGAVSSGAGDVSSITLISEALLQYQVGTW